MHNNASLASVGFNLATQSSLEAFFFFFKTVEDEVGLYVCICFLPLLRAFSCCAETVSRVILQKVCFRGGVWAECTGLEASLADQA